MIKEFIIQNLEIALYLFIATLLLVQLFREKREDEYPSLAKDLELSDVSIADIVNAYLEKEPPKQAKPIKFPESPVMPTPDLAEDEDEDDEAFWDDPFEPATPPEDEDLQPKVPEQEQEPQKKPKRRKKRDQGFKFNAKDAIIYDIIMKRKYGQKK